MTGVAIWVTFKTVLVLGLGFPERAGGSPFVNDVAGPKMRSFDVRDRIFGGAALLLRRKEIAER